MSFVFLLCVEGIDYRPKENKKICGWNDGDWVSGHHVCC